MAPLLEPIPISDIFCSGIGAIEAIGSENLRFYLYVDQRLAEAPDSTERIVVAKIIVPRSAVPPVLLRLLAVNGLMRAQDNASGEPLQ